MTKWNDSYYSVAFNSSGHKFYGLGFDIIEASCSLSVESEFVWVKAIQPVVSFESELVSSSIKIAYASVSLSGDVHAQAYGAEYQDANVSLSFESDVVVNATLIEKANISIDVESDCVSTSIKIAKALVDLSSESELTVLSMKDAYAAASPSATLYFTTSPIEILFPATSLSCELSVEVAAYEIVFASISISIETNKETISFKSFKNKWNDSYYSVTFNSGGYKFYGQGFDVVEAQCSLSGDSECSAFAIQRVDIQSVIEITSDIQLITEIKKIIKAAQIEIAIESDLVALSVKDAFASASLSADAILTIQAQEILSGLIEISGESELSVTSLLIQKAASSVDCESEIAVSCIKFAYSAVEINSDAQLIASSVKDAFASSSLDGTVYLTTSPIEILLPKTEMFATSDCTVTAYEILHAQSSIEISSEVSVTAIEQLKAFIVINSDASASATSLKFAFSAINVNIEVTASTSGYEILFPTISIENIGDVAVSATRVQPASSEILDSDLTVTASAIEILYALASVSGELVTASISYKDAFADSSLVAELQADIAGTRIQEIESVIDGLDLVSSATALEIQYALSSIEIESNSSCVAEEIVKAFIDANVDGSVICDPTHIWFLKPSLSLEVGGDVSILSIKGKSIEDAWTDSYFSVTFPGRGYRFYGVDAVTDLVIVRIYGESDVSCEGTRIHNAHVSIDADVNLECQAVKRLLLLSGELNFVPDVDTIKFAQIPTSSETSVDVYAYKIAISDVEPMSGESDSQQLAIEILYASTETSGIVINVVVGKEILLAKTNIDARVSLLIASAIRFSNSITEDTQSIRPLIMINNKPITEHNRKFNMSVNQSFIENVNWNSRRNRYYKTNSGRSIFSLSWSFLPGERENTADLRFARNFISQIGANPDAHVLKILNVDSDGVTPYTETEYNVIVKSYSESLIRRDLVGDDYYWDCSLELEEVS